MENEFRPLDDVIDELREQIETDVKAGFLEAWDVEQSAVDAFQDRVEPAALEAAAERLTEEALAAHARAQATWPAETDCDRLDAAFAALEERGIVARQHFSCCNNCGSQEIWGEVDEARAEGRVVRGCTFYHEQDTDCAVEGGGVHLGYQSVAEGDEAMAAVGREIVDVLRAHGLHPEWNGSPKLRVHVPMDWKRRRA
ncbi:MAG TPA: hypothetical protein VFJ82_05940 [Longimicrobium sp.]|nr:hypothetical protein [Longimicrobium sp.]